MLKPYQQILEFLKFVACIIKVIPDFSFSNFLTTIAVHEIKFILYYKTTQLIRYSYNLQIKNVLWDCPQIWRKIK